MRTAKVILIVIATLILTVGGIKFFSSWSKSAIKKINNDVVAIVNNEEISKDDFIKGLNSSGYTTISEDKKIIIKKNVLKNLINEKLVLQFAEKNKITVTDTEVKARVDAIKPVNINEYLQQTGSTEAEWINLIKKQMLMQKTISFAVASKIEIKDEEISEHYENHKQNYTHPVLVKIAQISFDSERLAKDVLKKIHAGDDFMDLAKKYSLANDPKSGVVAGPFSKENIPDQYLQAIDMKLNDVSSVQKNQSGYFVFKVVERKEAGIFDLNEIKHTIMNEIRSEKERVVYQEWIKSVVGVSLIQKNDLLIKSL